MLSNGFIVSDVDNCLYHHFIDRRGVIICLYINNMLIMGTKMESIENFKRLLSFVLKMKDLREVDMILRINIVRSKNKID